MKELNKEQFDQLPEFVQDDYVLDGDSYKHAGVLKMKSTLNDLNGKLEAQKGEYNSLNGRLTEFESNKAAEIEQARTDALEKAKKDNNVDDILRIEREKLDDEKRRIDETSKSFNERMKLVAENQEKSIAKSLANELAVTKGKAAFEKLIAEYIKVDPMTGLETFLNDDGSASSLNREQFALEVKKNELFASLVKADIHASGGGNINGSNEASGGKDPKKMNSKERVEFKQRDPDGFKKAFNL